MHITILKSIGSPTRIFWVAGIITIAMIWPLLTIAAPSDHWMARGEVGGARLFVDDAHLGITAFETDTLTFDNADAWRAAIGLGYVYPLSMGSWQTKIKSNISLSHQFRTELSGNTLEYGDPTFNNYQNKTKIDATTLLLNLELDLITYRQLSFFVLGGAGAGWTRVKYQETRDDNILSGEIDLDNNTTTTFVWQSGAGFSYAMTQHMNALLTYLYTDLGDVATGESGRTDGIAYPDLDAAQLHLREQSIMLGLEWNFL